MAESHSVLSGARNILLFSVSACLCVGTCVCGRVHSGSEACMEARGQFPELLSSWVLLLLRQGLSLVWVVQISARLTAEKISSYLHFFQLGVNLRSSCSPGKSQLPLSIVYYSVAVLLMLQAFSSKPCSSSHLTIRWTRPLCLC